MDLLGVPALTEHFPGIDRLGACCRVADSVTVMRLGQRLPGHGIVCGDEVSLYEGVRLVLGDPAQHPDTGLRFGNRVIVNCYSYLSGEGGLQIEDEVLIGPQVQILSAGHQINGGHRSIWHNPLSFGKIHIRTGVWIAAGAVIHAGVTVGEGAVVAAASVVKRDVPAFAIVSGHPAQLLGYRRGFEP